MNLAFEWDANKAAENLRKHGVSFSEALTVFSDPMARIFFDEGHSQAEHRELVVGYSVHERLLVVSFTERGDRIRIISARVAARNERSKHEEET